MTRSSVNRRPTGRSSLVSPLFLFVLSPMFFLVLPEYVGALTAHLGLTDHQTALLVSAELGAGALASFAATFWIRRWSWRRIAWIGSVLLFGINFASIAAATDGRFLLATRFLAGFLEGSLFSTAVAALSDTDNPDRSFGLGIIGQLAVSGVLLAILPHWIERSGVAAVYLLFSLSIALFWAPAFFFPQGVANPGVTLVPRKLDIRPLWGLAGMAFLYTGQSAVWAYLERMGVAAGLSGGFVGLALGAATFAGIIGALAASMLPERLPRLAAMAVAAFGQIACLVFLDGSYSAYGYLAAVALCQAFWMLWVPLQMGVIAQLDASGKAVVLIPLFQAAGIAAGPGLSGVFLSGQSYAPVIWIGCVFALLSLLASLPICPRKGAVAMAR